MYRQFEGSFESIICTTLPIIFEILILRYKLKGKARTCPEIFKVVLGPCAQFYPCEASGLGAKMGPNTKNQNLNQKR